AAFASTLKDPTLGYVSRYALGRDYHKLLRSRLKKLGEQIQQYYVDVRLDEHEHSTNHPDATLTQKGFTRLSNATDSDDETKAAT
ncbi:DUF1730 domain-containing protein, partial [Salmonella enterica subsp. enterica serovar Anatum]|nr:DUF1730 domain-containing protein [Salmonella enterica subsp. enterica serovar Anatum]